MRRAKSILAIIALGCIARAQTTPRPDARTLTEDAGQRQAILAMQESLARQRAAVQTQPQQHESSGFFVLPPPAPLGAPAALTPVAVCAPLPASEVDSLIAEAAKREELDPDIIRSVMKQESGFRPCAVSPKGAMGLMQLMPATAEQYGVQDPFSPVQNVGAGARLLKELLKRYNGDLRLTLSVYNAGSAAVDAAGGVPQIRETIDYISRILHMMGW